jgi:hypothetical protein
MSAGSKPASFTERQFRMMTRVIFMSRVQYVAKKLAAFSGL